MADIPNYSELADHAREIRKNSVTMSYESKTSHVGCALSFADILSALYFNVAHIDPKDPDAPDRDRIILSKGHGVVGLYAALGERGFFPKSKFSEYCREGSTLASHVVHKAVPGAETSGGSGGHGLPIGVGMAVGLRNQKFNSRVIVLSGDGELEEGSVWEALLFAAHHKLSNLVFVVDKNNLQDGTDGLHVSDILNLDPLDEKFRAFGWDVDVVDGHSFDELITAFDKKTEGPHAIIANTIKGKGVSFMENIGIWHGKVPSDEQYAQAMKELS
jgi:transketolase